MTEGKKGDERSGHQLGCSPPLDFAGKGAPKDGDNAKTGSGVKKEASRAT